jgi:hypothetical protein
LLCINLADGRLRVQMSDSRGYRFAHRLRFLNLLLKLCIGLATWAIPSITSDFLIHRTVLRFSLLHFTTMHPTRPLNAMNPLRPGRSFTAPTRPADDLRPGSPASISNSSFFEGGTETVISLNNPWPPTPQISPSSTPGPTSSDSSLAKEGLLASASCVS